MTVHEAYIKALEACKRAQKQGKSHIAIQATKDGLRLIAVHTGCFGTLCPDVGSGVVVWAQNILYRLCSEHVVDFTSDDVDTYFDRLGEVGY